MRSLSAVKVLLEKAELMDSISHHMLGGGGPLGLSGAAPPSRAKSRRSWDVHRLHGRHTQARGTPFCVESWHTCGPRAWALMTSWQRL